MTDFALNQPVIYRGKTYTFPGAVCGITDDDQIIVRAIGTPEAYYAGMKHIFGPSQLEPWERDVAPSPLPQMMGAKLPAKKSPALAGQELTYGKGRGVGQSPSGTRVTRHVRKCSRSGQHNYKHNLIEITLRQNSCSGRSMRRFSSPQWRPFGQAETMPRQRQVHRGAMDCRTAVEKRVRQDERHRHHPMRIVSRFVSTWPIETLTCRAYCTFPCGSSTRDFGRSAISADRPSMYANVRSESIATNAAPSQHVGVSR